MYTMGHGNLNDGHTVSKGDKFKIVDSEGRVLYESVIEKLKESESVKDKEDEDIGDTLVIWLKNGQTLYFNNVRELWETSDKLAFAYYGMETQVRREANFKLDCIAGYAVEEG